MHKSSVSRNLKGRDHLGGFGLDVRLTVKRILSCYDVAWINVAEECPVHVLLPMSSV